MKIRALLVLLVLVCLPVFGQTIHLFTDFPNATPLDSDFFVLQRNRSYVNSTPAQVRTTWFNNPTFTGTGNTVGNFIIGGIYYGNGAGITNFGTAFYLFKTNDIGNQETFVGPTTFTGNGNSVTLSTGTSLFGSISGGTNLQPTFLTLTADPNDPNTRRAVAGANITFTDGGAGSTLTIAASATNFTQVTTNNTFVNTNVFISTSNVFLNNVLETNVTVINETNSIFVNTNIAIFTNNTFINNVLETNVTVINETNSVFVNTNIAIFTNNVFINNETVTNSTTINQTNNTFVNTNVVIFTGNSKFNTVIITNTTFINPPIGNGGSLTNINGQSVTGAVVFVQWDCSAFITNSAFNSNTLAYVTPGAGNAALQGSSTCPFLLYPLSTQQGGTNQVFTQWTPPPGIANAIGTFSFNLLLATNTPSVQSNIVAMIQASANGAALGTAIIQTNISPVGTGFLSTNISMGPLTISGTPIANSPVQFQLQLWNVTTGRITNAAWIESCRWTYTNSATQNGLLTGW